MKKFFVLTKLLFVQQYRVKNTGKKKERIAIYIALAVCFLPMLISWAVGFFEIGRTAGVDTGIVSALLLACQMLTAMFGVSSIMVMVFNGADSQKLLHLPISSTTIFWARMLVVYANELLTSLVFVLVALLPYGIGAGASAAYFLTLPFALLLMPMLPLLLGALIAMPMSALSAKFKSNWLKIVFQLLVILAVFAAYGGLMAQAQRMDEEGVLMQDAIQMLANSLRNVGGSIAWLQPVYMLATALTLSTLGSWLLAFLSSVVGNALLFGLLLLVSLPFYKWILFASVQGATGKKSQHQLKFSRKGVVTELAISDFKRTVRHSQLGLQVVVTVVLPVVIIAIFLLTMGGELSAHQGEGVFQLIAPFLVMMFVGMISGSNMLSIFPFSRENNALMLLKTYPVSFRSIVVAKLLLANAVSFVGNLVCTVAAAIILKIWWYNALLVLFCLTALTLGISCVTTYLDLKSPNLGWQNFNQNVKNSKNALLSIAVEIICCVSLTVVFCVFASLYAAFKLNFLVVLMWIVILALTTLFAIFSFRWLVKRGEGYFQAIEL